MRTRYYFEPPLTSLNMGIFRSAYQVLSNEGLLALLKETKQYIRYRTLSAIPEPIYQLYLPNTTSFEVDGIVADFDMAIVSQRRDFRHDFHSEKKYSIIIRI
jgi:hypothetical protein